MTQGTTTTTRIRWYLKIIYFLLKVDSGKEMINEKEERTIDKLGD